MTYDQKVEYEKLIHRAQYHRLSVEDKDRLNYLSKLKIEALRTKGLPLPPVLEHWDIKTLKQMRNYE